MLRKKNKKASYVVKHMFFFFCCCCYNWRCIETLRWLIASDYSPIYCQSFLRKKTLDINRAPRYYVVWRQKASFDNQTQFAKTKGHLQAPIIWRRTVGGNWWDPCRKALAQQTYFWVFKRFLCFMIQVVRQNLTFISIISNI